MSGNRGDYLTKIKAAQDVIGALVKIRDELSEDAKQYLMKNTSEEKPLLTGEEYYIYKARTEYVVEMEKIIEIVRDYYKTKINNHSEGRRVEVTTPEKIEQLLNVFDVSLKDLPKPVIDQDEADIMAYCHEDHELAEKCIRNWFPIAEIDYNDAQIAACLDFINHQSDVIEKLVKALSIAKFDLRIAWDE